jgi:hypothetical protein
MSGLLSGISVIGLSSFVALPGAAPYHAQVACRPRNGQHLEEMLAACLLLPAGEIACLIDAGIAGVA